MSEPLTREPWNGVPLNPERDGWHWIARDGLEKLASWSDRGVWTFMGIDAPPEDVTGWGWAYLGPVLTPSEHRALLDRAEAAEREAQAYRSFSVERAQERNAETRRADKAEAERDAALEENRAFVNDVWARLADPNAVHINMLRGTIAKPTLPQIKHLYPEIKKAEAERDAARAALRCAEFKLVSYMRVHGPDRSYVGGLAAEYEATVQMIRAALAPAEEPRHGE
jgi:hypothetical protein